MPARAAATKPSTWTTARRARATEFEAREIIDGGFLELVRYGVRRADDPLMVDSLKVVDAVLKRGSAAGARLAALQLGRLRQRPDGGPFQGWGQGRVWPLLTGERAHYELAAGNDIAPLIKTYERFATMGQMMPEQVWDEAVSARSHLELGKPAGSAVPLVWAHAEYLKLLRSASDGKVFDRIDPVYERYCDPEGAQTLGRGLEIFTLSRPIQTRAVRQCAAHHRRKPLCRVLVGGQLEDHQRDPQPQPR